MRPVELDDQAVRRELDLVLGSEGFARNERLSSFLRFVVERHLEGRDPELKESVIAVEIFGRSPDYNPRRDPIVRTEATRLRARLSQYYVSEGKDDALVIELPKGGYSPCFHQAAANPAIQPQPPTVEKAPRQLRWFALAVGCFAVAVAATVWWWAKYQRAPIPVAVLPLTNLSQDPANDYFTDGLTDEIIRNLSIIDGLAVRSQTSSFEFKGKSMNVREAGRQLNADYIVEGSVLRAGQQLRINAQLVRVHDDFALWSGKYDLEATDIFAIQDEISRGIVNSLRLKLGRGRRRYETSIEAYDLYLRGRGFEVRPSLGGIRQAAPLFEETVARDPAFAPAYAGLAVTYAAQSGFDKFEPQERADQLVKMRASAAKAIQLDPLLAEAHEAMGLAYARDAQWEQSERSFRRAIELDPSSSSIRYNFASGLLTPLNRLAEALAQVQFAAKSDPLSAQIQHALARQLFKAGRFQEAVAHCAQPCTEALLLSGKAAEAIPILESRYNADLTRAGSGELGRAYALAGRRADAERIARIQWRPFEQASIFVALGDKDRAVDALERAIPLGPVRLGRELTYAEFAALRGDSRVKPLRKKVGLPE
jgi:TolB-like protein/cytochrome c-type biogenesis protein CcmH/NrfG